MADTPDSHAPPPTAYHPPPAAHAPLNALRAAARTARFTPAAAVEEAVRQLPAPLAAACPELLVDYLLEVFDEADGRPLPAGR